MQRLKVTQRKRLRTRFEADHEKVLREITAWGYPCPWTVDALRTECITFRVEDPHGPVAYLWAHWSDIIPGDVMTLDFHACAGPFGRGMWLTPSVLQTMLACAELMGAECLVTRPNGPDAPRIRRLLARLGFEDRGAYFFMRLEDGLHSQEGD